MSDLGNIDLDKQPDPQRRDTRRLGAWVAGALALLLAGGGLFYYTRRPPQPAPPTEAVAPAPVKAPAPASPADSRPPLPALGDSDTLARDLIGGLSSRPELTTWLLTDDVIRSITAMVDRVAQGQVPRRQLGIVAPVGPFTIQGPEAAARVDPASYRRYDPFGDLVSSFDASGTAQTYDRMRPLFDDAYRDLGYPGGRFDTALEKAIDQILGTPLIDGEIRLVTKGAGFGYADDRLESASPVQRQLMRMGPRNIRLIQGQARAFSAARGPTE